ncbi:hypothetical protein [Streptomyces sp. NBC_01643]|uniref:hypothetical protein n=1 Tax=Streptomyces sp. NBC_01643 TaxID=2975906 RepID=UPI00386A54B9|nr:hypothetical protein OHB03_34950 [Streptomyces sp. NBC_01643]
MTGFAGEEGDEENAPGEEAVCVLDAVVCVHFAGANLNRVLTAALSFAGWVILVPGEVCDEVRGKDRKYPGLEKRWAALERSPYIKVLPKLELTRQSDARVIGVLEELRQAEFEQAVQQRKDLGECVVVAHGVHLREQGHDVTLLMDDGGGQAMAAQRDLTVATIEDVLALAIHAGCFATLEELAKAYEQLLGYGSGLPVLRHTTLGAEFRRWQGARG